MNRKAEYLTPEWKIKRLFVLVRDKCKCVKCGTDKYLQVHHILYDNRLHAWEYEDEHLQTLCKSCHDKEHHTAIDAFYSRKKLCRVEMPKTLVKYYLKPDKGDFVERFIYHWYYSASEEQQNEVKTLLAKLI